MLPLSPRRFHSLLILTALLALMLTIEGRVRAQCSPPVANDDGPLTVHGPSVRLDQTIFANDTSSRLDIQSLFTRHRQSSETK